MTVTHFPHIQHTFGIIFGCAGFQKKYILQRLNLAVRDSGHPLLLPGVFAELERKRHNVIFTDHIDKLGSIIPESAVEGLLSRPQSRDYFDRPDKRTVYLTMLYLKQNLTSWSH
ncbi:hypothetical protein GGR51DRAFT_405927 [Nemania sp. FL0031]|nr:hypothetical protein GGR51DRAFT_405927 [Nemania sp. FL0031]